MVKGPLTGWGPLTGRPLTRGALAGVPPTQARI